MKIAYVAPMEAGKNSHPPVRQRAAALARIGHEIASIDPWSWVAKGEFGRKWLYHAGGLGFSSLIGNRLFSEVAASKPDLIFVNQGEFLSRRAIINLRNLAVPIVVYLNDDPFNGRDGNRFINLLKALPYYDLVVVVREPNLEEARRAGARRVIRVWMSADEVAHAAHPVTELERRAFRSDVALIGIWMPERGALVYDLMERGIPISIWGDRWERDDNWKKIKAAWRGPKLHDAMQYRAAVLSSKVCLGVLSKGNRDQHTTRSIEIPLIGGLLCAERTPEHQQMYVEMTEAFFWSNSAECAKICRMILDNDELRQRVALNGHFRARQSPFLNEIVLGHILKQAVM